jgi:hypothetical protein
MRLQKVQVTYLNRNKSCPTVLNMALHDICLGCGHKRWDHTNSDSNCNNDQCKCPKFKHTTLEELP